MGLGSDSDPVHVQLHRQDTFLADSMQFTLEYASRLNEESAGAYYVGCFFRGEDHDQTHFNQFYHIECELRGSMDDGIQVAERYITTVVSELLQKHQELISKPQATPGTSSDCFISTSPTVGNSHVSVSMKPLNSQKSSLPQVRGSTPLSRKRAASMPQKVAN